MAPLPCLGSYRTTQGEAAQLRVERAFRPQVAAKQLHRAHGPGTQPAHVETRQHGADFPQLSGRKFADAPERQVRVKRLVLRLCPVRRRSLHRRLQSRHFVRAAAKPQPNYPWTPRIGKDAQAFGHEFETRLCRRHAREGGIQFTNRILWHGAQKA